MTHVSFSSPALAPTEDGAIVRFHEGETDAITALVANQAKIAAVQVRAHDGTSAFEASLADDAAQTRLEQRASVANLPVTFVPIGGHVWAGVQPGAQQVQAPIQIEFNAAGEVGVRVAADWAANVAGMVLVATLET